MDTDKPIIPYAGIGSRKTPKEVLERMRILAMDLAENGFLLRSGGADGADTAFETGVNQSNCPDRKEIFLPSRGFNKNKSTLHPPPPAAFHEAYQTRKSIMYMPVGTRRLMARNCQQVLGRECKSEPGDHSRFVICWTPNGKYVGGTSMAMEVANRYNIQIFNLFHHPKLSICTILDIYK